MTAQKKAPKPSMNKLSDQVRRSNLPPAAKQAILELLKPAPRGRPRDALEKQTREEFNGALLRAEYQALREHFKGRRTKLGGLSPMKLLEKRYGVDQGTLRRRMKKVRGLWDELDRIGGLAATYVDLQGRKIG